MDTNIFKKMKVKPNFTAMIFHEPNDYPKTEAKRLETGQADFVHVFVENQNQFKERFSVAEKSFKEDGLFWVSYPKSNGKKVYDINRDSLWDLLLTAGFHPVAQISLNEEWSAVRVKRNEAGVTYERPGNVKGKIT
jgi:RNAse (barnase) inhibitor barstar